MIRPRTFRGPRPRAARAAQTAESSPPESPRTALSQPHRPSSSRMNRTRTFSTKAALIFGSTDDPFERPPDGLRLLVELEQEHPAGLADVGEIDRADDDLGVEIGRPGDEPAAGRVAERSASRGQRCP